MPEDEYQKRFQEIKRLASIYNVKVIEGTYDNDLYLNKVEGFEEEREGKGRCDICYLLRLEETSQYAKLNNFDYFATTLTVSPYKNTVKINEIGELLERKYEVKYLYSDFKKRDGYKKSIELSKKYNLYRQDYCGCIFSNIDLELV